MYYAHTNDTSHKTHLWKVLRSHLSSTDWLVWSEWTVICHWGGWGNGFMVALRSERNFYLTQYWSEDTAWDWCCMSINMLFPRCVTIKAAVTLFSILLGSFNPMNSGYSLVFIIPLTVWNAPVSLEAQRPLNMILQPPCFTFFSAVTATFFSRKDLAYPCGTAENSSSIWWFPVKEQVVILPLGSSHFLLMLNWLHCVS